MMTPRSYFTLLLRGIGIWKIIDGFDEATTAWNVHEKFFTSPYVTPGAYVGHAFTFFFIGIILLFFAAPISALIVPAKQANDGNGDAP